MPLERIGYRFRQRLPASRERAFRWATDYRPDDLALMGENGRRRVKRLAENLVLLTDVIPNRKGQITKQKLVHLFPDRRAWTNTHLSGPSRHSQFLYELRPLRNGNCELAFSGFQVDRVSRTYSPLARRRRAEQLIREDAAAWRRLARAMKADLH